MHSRDANFRRLSMVRPERYGDDARGPGAAAIGHIDLVEMPLM